MKTGQETALRAAIGIYVRHAQKFGTEEVLAAAIDKGISYDALILLQEELDKLDAQQLRYGKRGPRLSAETRVRRQLGLPDEKEAAK